jgi:hypothetical protein
MPEKKPSKLNRYLQWDACINTREMGGYPVENGTIRWKSLIRSDNTARVERFYLRNFFDPLFYLSDEKLFDFRFYVSIVTFWRVIFLPFLFLCLG